jgi:hypothetical protein
MSCLASRPSGEAVGQRQLLPNQLLPKRFSKLERQSLFMQRCSPTPDRDGSPLGVVDALVCGREFRLAVRAVSLRGLI